jgi:hypothetical protein
LPPAAKTLLKKGSGLLKIFMGGKGFDWCGRFWILKVFGVDDLLFHHYVHLGFTHLAVDFG